MDSPTFEQARMLLQRWGYEPVLDDPNVSPYDRIALARSATVWRKDDELVFVPPETLDFLINRLASLHKISRIDIKRIMSAEPGQIRNLGAIEVVAQEFDADYQGKVPHSPAILKMDRRGRDRLIAALIEGRNEIAVYDEAGEGYSLLLEAIDG